jgi:hypothetical protein
MLGRRHNRQPAQVYNPRGLFIYNPCAVIASLAPMMTWEPGLTRVPGNVARVPRMRVRLGRVAGIAYIPLIYCRLGSCERESAWSYVSTCRRRICESLSSSRCSPNASCSIEQGKQDVETPRHEATSVPVRHEPRLQRSVSLSVRRIVGGHGRASPSSARSRLRGTSKASCKLALASSELVRCRWRDETSIST